MSEALWCLRCRLPFFEHRRSNIPQSFRVKCSAWRPFRVVWTLCESAEGDDTVGCMDAPKFPESSSGFALLLEDRDVAGSWSIDWRVPDCGESSVHLWMKRIDLLSFVPARDGILNVRSSPFFVTPRNQFRLQCFGGAERDGLPWGRRGRDLWHWADWWGWLKL